MNDLNYSDWMKFQKSFFHYTIDRDVVEDCIYFFTKARWPDERPSRSLILGFRSFDPSRIPPPRRVEAERPSTLSELMKTMEKKIDSNATFDFVLADLRSFVFDPLSLAEFLDVNAEEFWGAYRDLLYPERYGAVVVTHPKAGNGGFPIPWALATAARREVKLRDEKVGLTTPEGPLHYLVVVQNESDERPDGGLHPKDVQAASSDYPLPAWVIPKPAPRSRKELEHPAKFPEELVSEFLDAFTERGDHVLDPMVGTGSTVVAAIRAERNAVGVELNPDFAEMAKRRVQEEYHMTIYGEVKPEADSLIIEGDAVNLGDISELQHRRFHYAITSPPYWSMLKNPGSEGQRTRREKELPLVYSQDARDLGNIEDYDEFLSCLLQVFGHVADLLHENGQLTVVTKNIKRNHVIFPLAWDLVRELAGRGGRYEYLGTTLWCQDDVGLKPFAVGTHWVSNTLHHYCLHFRRRTSQRGGEATPSSHDNQVG